MNKNKYMIYQKVEIIFIKKYLEIFVKINELRE